MQLWQAQSPSAPLLATQVRVDDGEWESLVTAEAAALQEAEDDAAARSLVSRRRHRKGKRRTGGGSDSGRDHVAAYAGNRSPAKQRKDHSGSGKSRVRRQYPSGVEPLDEEDDDDFRQLGAGDNDDGGDVSDGESSFNSDEEDIAREVEKAKDRIRAERAAVKATEAAAAAATTGAAATVGSVRRGSDAQPSSVASSTASQQMDPLNRQQQHQQQMPARSILRDASSGGGRGGSNDASEPFSSTTSFNQSPDPQQLQPTGDGAAVLRSPPPVKPLTTVSFAPSGGGRVLVVGDSTGCVSLFRLCGVDATLAAAEAAVVMTAGVGGAVAGSSGGGGIIGENVAAGLNEAPSLPPGGPDVLATAYKPISSTSSTSSFCNVVPGSQAHEAQLLALAQVLLPLGLGAPVNGMG